MPYSIRVILLNVSERQPTLAKRPGLTEAHQDRQVPSDTQQLTCAFLKQNLPEKVEHVTSTSEISVVKRKERQL